MKNEDTCPCKSGKTFGECCGPIISGEKKAESPEALMRARYSSYVTGDVLFLKSSATEEVQAEILHENGIDMQLNLMSLTGHYGPDARAKALRLLKEGWYSRVGTDLHRLRPFQHAIGVKCLTQKQIALIPKYSEQ